MKKSQIQPLKIKKSPRGFSTALEWHRVKQFDENQKARYGDGEHARDLVTACENDALKPKMFANNTATAPPPSRVREALPSSIVLKNMTKQIGSTLIRCRRVNDSFFLAIRKANLERDPMKRETNLCDSFERFFKLHFRA